jgi:tetratricopeptide (TPR) repeat protein
MIETRAITNPFPGLRPFETEEYRLFFGREGQADALIARLGRSRFLAVVGTSGSGKSSLVRAGLLPALRGGMMAGAGAGWRIAVMRPGNDPLGNLARALAEDGVLEEAGGGLPRAESEAVIEAALRRGSLGLVEATRQARLPEHEELLVVVDQFEELFRFRAARAATSTDDDASAFVKLLLEAARQREAPVYVVLTMRSDFLGDCAQFQGLPEAINDGQYLIPRMTRDERRVAVVGPVRVARARMSEPLVNRLLNDVGDNPDQLPILQHALMRTWDYWTAHRRDSEPIGLSDYEAIGTMSAALSLHADEAWGELPDERGRRVAEILFKALTERGADNREIRRPTRLREICEMAEASEAEVAAVVEVFRREGRSFLMPPAGVALTPDTVIDISHESLIRNWQRLKDWVAEEAQSARIYRRLAEAAVLHREGEEGLLQDPGLQIALDWREKSRPNAAWGRRYHPEFDAAVAYLEESRAARDAAAEERERRQQEELERERRERAQAEAFAAAQARAARRLRALMVALVVILLLALGTAAFAVAASRTASAERARAQTEELRAEEAARNAKVEQLRAEQAAREVSEGAARLKQEKDKSDELARNLSAEKEKTDKALASEKAAVEAQKKALAAQQLATEQAKEQTRKAKQNAIRLAASMDRSTAHLLGVAAFLRGDYEDADADFRLALDRLKDEERLLTEPPGPEDEKKFLAAESAQSKDFQQLLINYVRSSVLVSRGATQRQLGSHEDAVKSYSQAVQLLRDSDLKVRQVGGAEATVDAQWSLFDAVHGLAHAYHELADSRSKAGDMDVADYKKAEENYKAAVELQEKLLKGEQESRLAGGYENIARLYRDLGRYDEAEPYYKRILEIRAKQPESPEYVSTLKEVADFYSGQNKYDQAASFLETAARPLRGVYNAEAERELADIYGELAGAYLGQKDETKAKAAAQLARILQSLALRPSGDEEGFLNDLEAVGDAYVNLEEYGAAEEPYETLIKTLPSRSSGAAADDAAPVRLTQKLASLYRKLKQYDKAESAYRDLIKFFEDRKGDTARLAEVQAQLASLYADEMNKPAEAEQLFNRALATFAAEQGAMMSWADEDETYTALIDLYRRQNRGAELEQAFDRRLQALDKHYAEFTTGRYYRSPQATPFIAEYAKAAGEAAGLYLERKNTAQAEAAYRRAFDASQRVFKRIYNGKTLGGMVSTLEEYRALLGELKKPDEASKVAALIDEINAWLEQMRQQQAQ